MELPDPERDTSLLVTRAYEKSLGELRQGPDWPWSSYTATLCNLRGELVQTVMKLISMVRVIHQRQPQMLCH